MKIEQEVKLCNRILDVCADDIYSFVKNTAEPFFDLKGVREVLLCSLITACIQALMKKGKIILVRKE